MEHNFTHWLIYCLWLFSHNGGRIELLIIRDLQDSSKELCWNFIGHRVYNIYYGLFFTPTTQAPNGGERGIALTPSKPLRLQTPAGDAAPQFRSDPVYLRWLPQLPDSLPMSMPVKSRACRNSDRSAIKKQNKIYFLPRLINLL